jgi:translin
VVEGRLIHHDVEAVVARLDAANAAREAGLAACRKVIRASSSAIRAVHLLDPGTAQARLNDAHAALTTARTVLEPYPALAYAGFLHDAAKEYVEARATVALVAGAPVPAPAELGVEDPAWLNGMAEAASELRRHALDRLRAGQLDEAERLLASMDAVFGELVAIDAPDALTGGLRRTLDALRAVIERTRGDVTAAVLQQRLRDALDRRLG